MSATYYRHARLGHIVQVDGPQPKSRDVFAGTVIFSPMDPEAIVPGTYSQVWMRDAFDKVASYRPESECAPRVVTRDTVDTLQFELEMLRNALGVDAEPLDTLAERMTRAAVSYRKLYNAVKEWENEH